MHVLCYFALVVGVVVFQSNNWILKCKSCQIAHGHLRTVVVYKF